MTETVAQPDWHISSHDNYFGRFYRLNAPTGEFIAEVYPERSYEVILTTKPHTQYEWYLLTQRVISLVETARTSEKSEGRPSPNAVCHVCGIEGDEYAPYGWRCSRAGCQGTMFMPGTFPEPEKK